MLRFELNLKQAADKLSKVHMCLYSHIIFFDKSNKFCKAIFRQIKTYAPQNRKKSLTEQKDLFNLD